MLAREVPDFDSQPDSCRGDRRDGSAAGRSAAAQPDVRDPGRQLAAAARVLLQSRPRHSPALRPLPGDALSQGAQPDRDASANRVPPYRRCDGGSPGAAAARARASPLAVDIALAGYSSAPWGWL